MASDAPDIRILTVDDHALLRKGIGALISGEADMKAASSAEGRRTRLPAKGSGK
jgi:DNA-binding NarL/FixJ family response regulator